MSVSPKHILEQGAGITALGKVALSVVKQAQQKGKPKGGLPSLPGPVIRKTLPPRSPELIADYVRNVGGDPGAYKNTVPPHFFPQWAFALGAETILDLPYPMASVLNFGSDMQINKPIPQGEELICTARLESIDDDGRRAILQQRVVTGTKSAPDALVSDLFVFIPLKGSKKKESNGAPKAKKQPPRVPDGAKEIAFFDIKANAGFDFAKLTGDFNPIHWIPPAAKASGFKNVILHGFGTMARAVEGVNKGLFSGDVNRMSKWSCRFTKPLVLPAKVGLYVQGQDVFVGDAPGGPAYLVGSFETGERS